jgi:hypothetical protein
LVSLPHPCPVKTPATGGAASPRRYYFVASTQQLVIENTATTCRVLTNILRLKPAGWSFYAKLLMRKPCRFLYGLLSAACRYTFCCDISQGEFKVPRICYSTLYTLEAHPWPVATPATDKTKEANPQNPELTSLINMYGCLFQCCADTDAETEGGIFLAQFGAGFGYRLQVALIHGADE